MIAATIKDVKILFNQRAILDPADRFQVSLLRQMGALTRTICRRSIRPASRRRQVSQPGQPPLYHGGPISYRDTVFFVVDERAKEMVCGAVLLPNTKARGQAVPGILEDGGLVMKANHRGQVRPVYVRARPHTHPALDIACKKKLPDLIKGGLMREV